MSAKIPGLDHLRALAITLVFLFHYRLFPHPDWVDTIGSFGWTGVDLFFVLSGYLISGAIFREQKAGSFRLPTFYLKRGFRILPAFWAVLAVYFLIPGFREWEHLPPLWKMLSFTQNLGLDLRHQRTFSHAWSLCIEEQFYLLLPLALLLVHRVAPRRRNSWIILLLFAAGFITRLLSWNYLVAPAINTDAFGALWYKWIYYPTYNRLDGLLAGIAIAALQHHTRSASVVLSKHSGWLLLTGLALLGCAYQLCIEPQSFAASIFGFPFIALAYAFLVAASVTPKSILKPLVIPHFFRCCEAFIRHLSLPQRRYSPGAACW